MNPRIRTALVLALAALAAVACAPGGASDDAAPDAGTLTVVDSILPAAEALRRFTADHGAPVTTLGGGAGTPEALAERLLGAVARADSAALEDALISRAEFASLYFPHHPHARPPYSISPQLLWTLSQARSHQAVLRLRARVAGAVPAVRQVRCGAVEPHGQGRLHLDCVAAVRGGGDAVALGSLLEHGGRFKVATLDP